jgi:hypothetical protein
MEMPKVENSAGVEGMVMDRWMESWRISCYLDYLAVV